MRDVKSVLIELGYSNFLENPNEIRVKPLYRESDNNTSLRVCKRTGIWYDFGIGQGGSLKSLISKTLDIPELNSSKYLQDVHLEEAKISLNSVFPKTFPEDYLELKNTEASINYWRNRGISKFTLEKLGGGFCDNGNMYKRYVFPIKHNDYLVGFTGRDLSDNSNRPKWKHLGDKKFWVYPFNKKMIEYKKSIILVESIGDCLSLFEVGIENVAVLFGISLQKALLLEMLKTKIDKVYISLNNDRDNNLIGNKASLNIKKSLLNYFDEKNVIIALPKQKDLNEQLLKDKQGILSIYG